MRGFFDSLRSVLKTSQTNIDSEVFKLHYKVTFIILMAASLLVTGREYFGDAITCIPPGEEYMQKIVDTYCWIHATFTLPGSFGKKTGSEVAHPGVEKYTPDRERVYHKYYQWVCFVLFLQAVLFYAPRYLWKQWEAGKIGQMSASLDSPLQSCSSQSCSSQSSSSQPSGQVQRLAQYVWSTRRTHDAYLMQYVGCEVLNLVNVVVQIYAMDVFLGGAFSSFGLDVLRHSEKDPEERSDPMIRLFPRMTKCTFHFYGSSGDVQRYDTLCILPLNVINEKIFVLLWFWFVLLALLTAASLTARSAVLLSPRLRSFLLLRRARLSDRFLVRRLALNLSPADSFLLTQLARNVDPLTFRDLVAELSRLHKSNDPDRNGNGQQPLLSHSPVHSPPATKHDDCAV